MNLLKHRSMRFYLVFFLILTMAIGGSAIAAFASNGPVTATVSGSGGLTESGTFGQSVSATLDGTDQTPTYSLPVQLKDLSGSGAGWNLTISDTPLTDGASHTLSQSVTAASSSCAGLGACTNATSSTGYPVSISGTAQKFFDAAANTGMGVINVSTTVTVYVPATAYAANYTSTVSLAAVSGP